MKRFGKSYLESIKLFDNALQGIDAENQEKLKIIQQKLLNIFEDLNNEYEKQSKNLKHTKDKLSEVKKEYHLTISNITEQNRELSALEEELKTNNEELIQKNEILEHNERKYKMLTEITLEGIVLHKRGYIIELNSTFCDIFGYTKKELIGTNPMTFLFTPSSVETLQKRHAEGYDKSYRVQGVKKSGEILQLEVHGRNIEYDNEIVRVATVRDITEQIKNEQELILQYKKLDYIKKDLEQSYNKVLELNTKLEKSKLKYKIIADFNYDWEHWFKPDGTFEYVSPSCKRITGYTDEEFIKNPSLLDDIVINSDKQIWIKHKELRGVHNEDEEIVFRIKTKSGEIKWIGHKCQDVIINGQYLGRRGSNRDITNLLKLKEQAEFILKGTNAGTFDWLINKNDLQVNERWSEIIGYSKEELFPFNINLWQKLVHPEDIIRIRKEIAKLLNKSIDYYDETFRCRHKNGQWIWINARGAVTEWDEERRAIRMSGTHIDVTARKRFELELMERNQEYEVLNEELRQTYKDLITLKEKAEENDRLKTAFLHNMSHEIRTPMNGIIGFSNLLLKEGINQNKRGEFTKILKYSCNQLLRTMDKILEISQLVTKQIQLKVDITNIDDVIYELYQIHSLTAEEKRIKLVVRGNKRKEPTMCYTDRKRIMIALDNILENAIKFTRKGLVDFGYNLKNDSIEFFVNDTGIGVSKEMQNSIFKYFIQEDLNINQQYGGLGLGLSIAKENIDLLDGVIFFKTKKDVGTSFIISIPHVKLEHPPENKLKSKEKKKILIAEDEEINFLYLVELLNEDSNGDYEVLHAKDGVEALDLFHGNNDIDIALLDIRMPRMDGYELALKIKERNPLLPLIAHTAYTSDEDKAHALSMGFDAFLTKPIEKLELFKLINLLIEF